MKVFLGNSPWQKKGYYGVRAGSRWPHFEEAHHEYMPFPFFLAYATAILEEYDHELLLVDGIAEGISEKEFINRITSFGPDIIVLEVSTISIEVDLSLARKLRKIVGKEPKIAFCGLHAYMYQADFLKQNGFVDFVLVGEYEYTLRDMVNYLEKKHNLDMVQGLIFRDARGNVVVNERRPLISNLDELPWPARQYLPMENYHDEPGNIPRPSVQIQASRGCPFGCIFCAWPQIIYGSRQYRTRDPMDVVDEFEWLVKNWGFKSVYFDDDTFNIGKTRVLKICEGLRERRIETPWAAMCRADTMTPEMLEAMVESGLHAVKYGVETAHQGILKTSGKRLNIEKVKKTIQRTHELGVKTHLTFMFGLPGETEETARQTIELALDLNPESVQFSIATPFPGSNFFDSLEKQGLITHHDFSKYDGFRSAVVRTESLSSKDLEKIVEDANASWHQNVSERRPPEPLHRDNGFASVIIPNFNGKAFLKPCLDSLTQQTKRNSEIILVDNASTDGSVEFVNSHYPGVNIISLASNKGFSAAVNQGIGQAKGSFIAVLNNDTVVNPNWLEVLCGFLEENPHIGFCASKITKYDNPDVIDSVGHGIIRSGYAFNIGDAVKDAGQYDNLREVFGAPAAAAVYRRSMLNDIGLFDEDFYMYLEDVDLSYRAQLRGHKCMFVPQATVRHRGAGTTGSQYHKDNVYFIARNTIYILMKDVPKQILKSHFFRIFGFILYLQLYHTFRSFHAWSCLKGLYRGLKGAGQMVVKRKHILGGKRVSDDHIADILLSCEAEYKRFKREKAKK
jgi:anaerobic magnesium-protoporphyrin IX monomethyl ester cyclase